VVKVLDFGIAKAFRDDRKIDQLETQAGTVFGTPRYMSPEQAQGKALDHRSDLYSVGVLLYQLLTGQPPFLDEDAVVVMAKHIREMPPPVRRVVPDRPIPRSLEKALARAIAKEPDDRFASADAFEAALARCVPDVEQEIHRSRPSVLNLGGLPRIPLAIGGVVIALAVVAAVVIATSGPREDVAEARSLPTEPTPAAAPPAPGPAAPLVAAPRRVVTLASIPAGAAILRDGVPLGSTPQSFELADEEAMTVTLRAEGHEDADVRISAESPPLETVTLRPVEPPRSEPTATAGPRTRPPRRTPEGEAPTPTPAPTGDPYERFD
jgi:serine/threonine-protein kinase